MHRNELLHQAQDALKLAVPRAQADPSRPAFHFRAPAQRMNDPNGPIFHRGWHHIFYQTNPLTDITKPFGTNFWGHARSRDLVNWEHLPFALIPDHASGEFGCWSGTVGVNGEGNLVLLYTSVPDRADRGRIPFQQRAAIGDEEDRFLYPLRRQPHPGTGRSSAAAWRTNHGSNLAGSLPLGSSGTNLHDRGHVRRGSGFAALRGCGQQP